MEKLPSTVPAFFWHFIKKQPIAFSVFFAAPLLVILEGIVVPYALKLVIDAFMEYDTSREAIMEAITPALWLGGLAWFGLVVGARLQEWWQVHVMPRFEADIRMSTLKHLMQHSYNFFSGHLSGNLSNKINDLPRALDSLGMCLRWHIVATIGVVVTALVIMYFIQPFFALVVGIWVVVDLMISFSFVYYVNNAGKENAEDKSQLSGRIVDSIANIVATKLFSKRFHELAYVQEAQNTEMKSNAKVKWRIMIYRCFIDMPVFLLWWGVGYLLLDYWQKDQITTGDLVFIFNAIWTIMFRLWFLGEALAEMFKDYGIASQALSLIMEPHTLTDKPDAKDLKVKKGEIIFQDVSFEYNKGERVFDNKNLTIQPGQKIGLVGFSGSGKTTFVNLILRFFDIESGRIMIDGQNIADVTQDSLRSHISLIPQDTGLFHRSLMDNIRYGRLDATDEEIIAVSKKAYCHEFVEKLPEQYSTMVGERGIKLSGGQRQRIAIARAMLKDAPILILDEATSALDSITEKCIQESLAELMQECTTIVVAHRLSTLSEMDRILVFDNGHIIEDGTHEVLLKKKGHYARMWHMQAGGFLPEEDEDE